MTPDLPTCPREDCTATIDHHHGTLLTERAYACERPVGSKCTSHNDGRDYATRCYAPRTPQPKPAAVVLPTVDEVARLAYKLYWGDLKFRGAFEDAPWPDIAKAVLDLLTTRLPVWQPVEPGAVIKAGTVTRIEWDDRYAREEVTRADYTPYQTDPARFYLDPRTVPAEPEDPAVAVAAEWWEQTLRGSTAKPGPSFSDLLARIDAARADS